MGRAPWFYPSSFGPVAVIASFATVILGTACRAIAQAPVDVDLVVLRLIDDVEVPAPEEGVLKLVDVKEGDAVKVGDRLAGLDDRAAALAVEQARRKVERSSKEAASNIKVEAAEVAYRLASSQLETAKEAARKVAGSVTKAQLDELEHQFAQSFLGIKQAKLEQEVAEATKHFDQAELARAEHSLQQRTVVSPIDGTVVEVMKQPGEWVKPGEGIARVIRLDVLRAEGYLGSKAVAETLKNRDVTVYVASGGKPVEARGRVVFVSPEVDPSDGKFRVWAEVDNREGRLQPGLRGRMVISTTVSKPKSSDSRESSRADSIR